MSWICQSAIWRGPQPAQYAYHLSAPWYLEPQLGRLEYWRWAWSLGSRNVQRIVHSCICTFVVHYWLNLSGEHELEHLVLAWTLDSWLSTQHRIRVQEQHPEGTRQKLWALYWPVLEGHGDTSWRRQTSLHSQERETKHTHFDVSRVKIALRVYTMGGLVAIFEK